MNYSANSGQPSLSTRLEQLVGNSLHSDFTFIIVDDNVEIPAHKLIIALASPVIDIIVYGNDSFTPKNSIKIDGISKKSFMEILRYIYTDNINLNEDNIIEVLYKANYFGLTAIEAKCYDYIKRNLNVSTVPKVFHHIFHTSSPPKLLNMCFQFIRIEPISFFAADEFPSLSIVALKLILEMNAINCTEVDLFEALIKLAKDRCIMEDLHPSGSNQRKVLDGSENLLRMDSLSAAEFDNCLSIEPDFFTSKEIEGIRQNIKNLNPTQQRRRRHTYQDSVWLQVSNTTNRSPSCFSYGSTKYIFRCLQQEESDTPVVSDNLNKLFNMHNGGTFTIEILCGRGYEWRRCINGEVPIGAVSFSQKNTTPVFIGRVCSSRQQIGPVNIKGQMFAHDIPFGHDRDEDDEPGEFSAFEILVANNFKNREHYSAYIGNGIPNNAIFIGSEENNFPTYLGRAWYSNILLPAKIVFENESLVKSYVMYGYNNDEIEVDEFSFLCMDPGTFEWQEAKNGEIPQNVVIGFQTALDQTTYFGRCLYKETYAHGVINELHPSSLTYLKHGCQIHITSFEYLVHKET